MYTIQSNGKTIYKPHTIELAGKIAEQGLVVKQSDGSERPATAKDVLLYGVEQSTLENIESLDIDHSIELMDFADASMAFKGLKYLVIDLEETEHEHHEDALGTLRLPGSLVRLKLVNTMLRDIDVSSLQHIHLMYNPMLSGITIHNADLHSFIMTDCEKMSADWNRLLERFPKLHAYIDINSDHKYLFSAINNERFDVIDSQGMRSMIRVPKETLFQIQKKAEKILSEITTRDMSDVQKAVKICEYAAENFKYVSDEVMQTEERNNAAHHVTAGAMLRGEGVCESQAKAAVYLFQEAGIQASTVPVMAKYIDTEEALNVRKKGAYIIPEGEETDHMILRFKLGDMWYYADPTNDRTFDEKRKIDRDDCVSFLSREEMMCQPGNSGKARIAFMERSETYIPYYQSVARNVILDMRNSADKLIRIEKDKNPARRLMYGIAHIFDRPKTETELNLGKLSLYSDGNITLSPVDMHQDSVKGPVLAAGDLDEIYAEQKESGTRNPEEEHETERG